MTTLEVYDKNRIFNIGIQVSGGGQETLHQLGHQGLTSSQDLSSRSDICCPGRSVNFTLLLVGMKESVMGR